ncbi:hypothetical protein [Acetobacter oeni]|uniref:Uncharacterized protein n=1 Tax=Acetobacter oeni TaxID=304077 RepID=A0A511XJR6_9PROT|nr:hypothetical protein [Acetobacter oeni]MBB3883403.1 hypothetical protein [Acetobacter oeni]GBR03947.1 hypothetical protein AA21952_1237 [Acetobacter oeni LMG 21952]GEN63184.1 hypothetical protein AOE01nite_14080 [Acetobacter oeni]
MTDKKQRKPINMRPWTPEWNGETCMRNGRPLYVICKDRGALIGSNDKFLNEYPVVALNRGGSVSSFTKDGSYRTDRACPGSDLMACASMPLSQWRCG